MTRSAPIAVTPRRRQFDVVRAVEDVGDVQTGMDSRFQRHLNTSSCEGAALSRDVRTFESDVYDVGEGLVVPVPESRDGRRLASDVNPPGRRRRRGAIGAVRFV